MNSDYLAHRLSAACPEPVCRGQCDCIFGQHSGKTGKDIGEVFLGVDAQATTVFHDGVEDGAFLTGHLIADEQPVFCTKFGRTNRVFHEVVANFYPSVAKIGFELGPLVDGVADGFSEFAFGQDGGPEGEFVDGFLEPTMDHAAFGGADGFAQGGAGFGFSQACLNLIEVGELKQDPGNESRRLVAGFEKFPPHMGVAPHEFDPGFVFGPRWIGGVAIALDDAQQGAKFGINGFFSIRSLDFLKKSVHAFCVTSVMPVEKYCSTRNIRHPKIAGLRFAAAGLEVINGGFVNLSVKCSPMFVLDFSIDDGEPVGAESCPVAKGFAVDAHSHAGEHFGLPIVGQVADEAVIDHFGDEGGSGDAAFLQGGWQRVDEGLGGGVVFEDEFAAHELDADKLSGLVVKLFADFFADAAEFFGIEQNLGRIEFFADDGKVLGDARCAGLLWRFFVIWDFSRRFGDCRSNVCCLFLEIPTEHQFELCWIDLFAGATEDSATEGVDGLFKDDNLSSLARDDLIALCDLVMELLYFVADAHLLNM